MTERLFWLGFSVCPGIGPQRFSLLIQHFGSAKDAWHAPEKEIAEVIGKACTQKLLQFRETFSPEKYSRILQVLGVSFLTLENEAYPQLLKQIKNPPFVLYAKGNLNDLNHLSNKTIGIVGTRKITGYGRDVTEMITRDLVSAGCVIVSGLALGVDAVAHKTTLEHEGKTIAVLGCGVNLCYPTANEAIYNSILQKGGAVVSEYPIDQPPSVGSFPSRNRIIAGLSEAVVVTEGAEDSGALITASNAASLQRPVFAVPGPITSSLSKGPFKLIAQGAKLVTSAEDILKELSIAINPPSLKLRRAKGETKEEQMIIDLLQNEALSFDEIVRKTKISAATMGGILSMMEMKGVIKNTSHGFALHSF
ncbi:MAG: DNA-protecting protein DprA [Candidatus Levybacteria bacterium]|nr:DNA-protecting protein DprA [Candidatus Levybacteria bacterium]